MPDRSLNACATQYPKICLDAWGQTVDLFGGICGGVYGLSNEDPALMPENRCPTR